MLEEQPGTPTLDHSIAGLLFSAVNASVAERVNFAATACDFTRVDKDPDLIALVPVPRWVAVSSVVICTFVLLAAY